MTARNTGWDCCWIHREFNEHLTLAGWETLYTRSLDTQLIHLCCHSQALNPASIPDLFLSTKEGLSAQANLVDGGAKHYHRIEPDKDELAGKMPPRDARQWGFCSILGLDPSSNRTQALVSLSRGRGRPESGGGTWGADLEAGFFSRNRNIKGHGAHDQSHAQYYPRWCLHASSCREVDSTRSQDGWTTRETGLAATAGRCKSHPPAQMGTGIAGVGTISREFRPRTVRPRVGGLKAARLGGSER